MSRVLYVSQYFVSADQPGGVRHWQHTRALADAGHDVSVVTSYVQHKEREVPEEYRGKRVVREESDGLTIYRTYATPGYGRDLRSRLANYTTFASWSMVAMMRATRPDVVVASSPPLPAAAAAAAVAKGRRVPFVLEVRDLWPDSAVAMGMLQDGPTVQAAARLEAALYAQATRIIALTEGIRDGVLAKGVSPGKVRLVTNGIDLDIVDEAPMVPVDLPPDPFVAMYVGAHGTYSSLGTVLDAAELLLSDPAILFVLVGGGDQKEALLEDAAARGLHNVRFVDPIPKREVPSWLARADACILPYQDRELFAGALPNKTFDYLASGAPLVVAAPRGELTRLVLDGECGVVVPPEDPGAMANAIAALAADRARAQALGANGARLVRSDYDRAALAARFVETVESVAR
jgi:glycosyltransferase involved in cell wall biosynthesis